MDELALLATIITVLGSVIVAVLKYRADSEPVEDKVNLKKSSLIVLIA